MRILVFTCFLSLAYIIPDAQVIYKIKAESLPVTNDSCLAELNLENSIRTLKDFFTTMGTTEQTSLKNWLN